MHEHGSKLVSCSTKKRQGKNISFRKCETGFSFATFKLNSPCLFKIQARARKKIHWTQYITKIFCNDQIQFFTFLFSSPFPPLPPPTICCLTWSQILSLILLEFAHFCPPISNNTSFYWRLIFLNFVRFKSILDCIWFKYKEK